MPTGILDLSFLGFHRNEDWKCTLGSSVLKDLDSLKCNYNNYTYIMSLTTNNNQNQQGGAGDIDGTNGVGAGK